MPRKPLRHRRKPEILQAFARCIARRGIAGTSLDAVAEEAGMKRSILRHFVGNREQLVEETAMMVSEQAAVELQQILAVIPVWADSERVAMSLLEASHDEDPLAVFDILINECGNMPRVAKLVRRQFRELAAMLGDWLRGWSEQGQSADVTAKALLALRRQAVCRRRLGERRTGSETFAAKILLDQLKPSFRRGTDRFDQGLEEETQIGVND